MARDQVQSTTVLTRTVALVVLFAILVAGCRDDSNSLKSDVAKEIKSGATITEIRSYLASNTLGIGKNCDVIEASLESSLDKELLSPETLVCRTTKPGNPYFYIYLVLNAEMRLDRVIVTKSYDGL